MTPYEREMMRMDGRGYGGAFAMFLGIVLMLLWACGSLGAEPPAKVSYSLDAPPPAVVSYGLDDPWKVVKVDPSATPGVNPLTPDKPKRVRVANYWWDQRPDGSLVWCTECNGPFPAGGIPGYVVVDWNGHQPAVPGVAAPAPKPQGPVTGPRTTAPPATGPSSGSTGTMPTGHIGTVVPTTAQFGLTRGCATSG